MTYKHFNPIIDEDVELYFENATERSIFLQCAYWGDKNGVLHMTQGEIATKTLYSLATIKRIFAWLEKQGYLSRLKHGRYQILNHAETAEDNALKNKLRRWLKEKDCGGGESINIPEGQEAKEPEIFREAVEKGWLEKGKRIGVIVGRNEDKSPIVDYFVSYNVHFKKSTDGQTH